MTKKKAFPKEIFMTHEGDGEDGYLRNYEKPEYAGEIGFPVRVAKYVLQDVLIVSKRVETSVTSIKKDRA